MKKIRCRFGAVFLSSSEQKHRSVISIFTMFIYFNFLTKFSHMCGVFSGLFGLTSTFFYPLYLKQMMF